MPKPRKEFGRVRGQSSEFGVRVTTISSDPGLSEQTFAKALLIAFGAVHPWCESFATLHRHAPCEFHWLNLSHLALRLKCYEAIKKQIESVKN